jgi:short-subunit dehydrogenase
MNQAMSGKVVFLTGASSGIGEALAREYARQGAILALAARRTQLLEKIKKDCEALGARVEIFSCDVVVEGDVRRTVEDINKKLGPIDAVIANAGLSGSFKVGRFNTELSAKIIDVKVKGLLYTIGAVLPEMLKRNTGTVVGVSSLASYISFPQSYVYCASKSAVSAILQGLRLELSESNIQVTTICPGYIRTDMTASNQFTMPFLMDVDVAAQRIVRAIARGADVYDFPRRMRWIIRLLSLLPQKMIALPFRGGRDVKASSNK